MYEEEQERTAEVVREYLSTLAHVIRMLKQHHDKDTAYFIDMFQGCIDRERAYFGID